MSYVRLLSAGMLVCALSTSPAASLLQITEFAAAGRQGLLDEDGDTPDWIEIQNLSSESADLSQWSLSESVKGREDWRFPQTNVPPGGFIVVFASGKDRRVPGDPLHTNFKLGAEGGSIFLRGPEGVLSSIERYPSQVPGISFGLPGEGISGENRQVLIGLDAPLYFSVPLTDELGTNWITPDFGLAGPTWRRGQNGIGYVARGEGYRELLRKDVGPLMAGRSLGLYLLYPFVATNQPNDVTFQLEATYDDGFVAWLNGVEVARRNAPAPLNWNSAATATRRNDEGSTPEQIPLSGAGMKLNAGTNWLAVHVLNAGLESTDLLFRAILRAAASAPAVVSTGRSNCYLYLVKPTPGRPNSGPAGPGPRIEAVIHQPSLQSPTVQDPLVVTARVTPVLAAVQAVVLRYRVMFGDEVELPMLDDGAHADGSAGDGLYGASIPAGLAAPGQMVRYCVTARDEGGGHSRWPLFADRRGYSAYQGTVIADPSIQSRLPVLHFFSASASDRRSGRPVGVSVFYLGELYDNVTMSIHGQISQGFPKSSYNLDFPFDHHFRYQREGAPVSDLTLLGNFADKSKIRNSLAYEMIAAAGSVGHFAFPVRVQRNGKFFSIAEAVEDGDDRWLERVGRDPGGSLYKMDGNLNGAGGAEKKTRKSERDGLRGLATFSAALSEDRPLDQRAAYAYDHIDIPQCIGYFVALALISSGDHGHKNYYLYHDRRASGEWALFPWDVDLSWGRNWMNEYFNENLFVDNPLNLYRAGHHKARNPLYNLFFEHPEFRQMYLRRLRTVMDELLQPPGTAPESLIIERRIRELMDLLDPPEVNPSDAELDNAAWPGWGNRATMRSESQRIIDEYLPGRRNFLFKSSRAKLLGESIPRTQPAEVALRLLQIENSPPASEQFVCLTNQNNFAVDISGFRLANGGIQHHFRPGTVIPAGKAIFAVADVASFRRRSASPRRGESLFVQGNWKGRLQSGQGEVQLIAPSGHIVASEAVP